MELIREVGSGNASNSSAHMGSTALVEVLHGSWTTPGRYERWSYTLLVETTDEMTGDTCS